jgi:hypothetical protein
MLSVKFVPDGKNYLAVGVRELARLQSFELTLGPALSEEGGA